MPYLGSSHHACPQVLFPELGLDLVEGEKGEEEEEEHSLALSLSSWQVALETLPSYLVLIVLMLWQKWNLILMSPGQLVVQTQWKRRGGKRGGDHAGAQPL